MHCLESSEGLIDEVLAVIVRQLLGSDDSVHICLHQFLDQIHFREAFVISRFLDVEDGDYVFMVEVSQ